MQAPLDSSPARRLILELLKSTRTSGSVSLDIVSTYAACSRGFSTELFSRLGIPVRNGWVSVSRNLRLDLAIEEARQGYLLDASRFLDWQDFERFAERCLSELDYETARGTRVKGEGRSWQIDVIGIKEGLVLCIDCKHWAPPLWSSRFKNASKHQSKAAYFLAMKLSEENRRSISSLPIIVTLFEPPQQLVGDTVIVSIEKLPSLLNELTPYSPELPFIAIERATAENPIRPTLQEARQQ